MNMNMNMNMAYNTPAHRHITPPTGSDKLRQPYSAGSSNMASNESMSRYRTVSPQSDDTHLTTPPRSPCVGYGPVLLPKIRTQDQSFDRAGSAHQNSFSITNPIVTTGYTAQLQHASPFSRAITPPEYFSSTPITNVGPMGVMTPASTVTPVSSSSYLTDVSFMSPASPFALSTMVPQRLMHHSRNSSTASGNARARSGSPANVDDAILNRYAYPTYRQVPSYVPMASSGMQRTSPDPRPSPEPVSSYTQSLPAAYPLAAELLFENYAEVPSATTLHEYLTSPNPSPSLVRRTPPPTRNQDTHFWWDVRNISDWADFNLATIQNIPGFSALLDLPIPQPALPTPAPMNLTPDGLGTLHENYANHYAVKVNAALKMALGTDNMALISFPPTVQRPQSLPNFISHPTYPTSTPSQPHGRVVGLVKAFDQWNSGMQASSKVAFLQTLSQLHHHMRTQGCRYGFIMTEIELVCVRYGSSPGIPDFGALELAASIRLNAAGPRALTPCLALWYLHMLAKDAPLPGQCGWAVQVGGPSALTRQKFRAKDAWAAALRPEGRERRDAKRIRGWVMPEDPFSRKELGPKRGRRRE